MGVLTDLTAAQINKLNTEQLIALTAADIGELTPAQIKGLTAAQIAVLTAEQLSLLTPAQIAALPAVAVRGLTAAQLGAFTPLQISGFTPAQIVALTPAAVGGLTSAQIAAMTPPQLVRLTPPQIAALSTDVVSALTQDEIQTLTAVQIRSLTALQAEALTAQQLALFSQRQIASLSLAAAATFSADDMAGLSAAQIGVFSVAQIGALPPAALAALTPAQIAALSLAQMRALTGADLSAWSATQINALSLAQIASIAPAAFAALTPAQIGALTDAQISALTTRQANALTAEQISGFSAAQIAQLSAAVVGALSGQALAAMSTAQIGALTAGQIARLTVKQIGALSAEQIGAISPAAIGRMTIADIAALTAAQVAGLIPTQLAGMSALQIGRLNKAGLTGVSGSNTLVNIAAVQAVLPAGVAAGSYLVNNSLTYDAALAVLRQAATVYSNRSATTAQYAALRNFAAQLNAPGGISVTDYVKNIVDKVILGDPGNNLWTGGAATTAALGNLSAATSVQNFGRLIDKWFLGADLPSSVVRMDPGITYTVSYSPVSKPLFVGNGPSMTDVNQGYLGDCYLMAALAEMAAQDPSLIQSMITVNGNDTYGVRFFVDGEAEYVTVSNRLADGGETFSSGPALWASLVEQGYAQLQGSGSTTGAGPGYSFGNSFSSIGNGGVPEFALGALLGPTTITDYWNYGTSWRVSSYDSQMSAAWGGTISTQSLQATLIANLDAGYIVELSSNTGAENAQGQSTLVASHAFAIYDFDEVSNKFEVYNPWGAAPGQDWATSFELSLSELLGTGDIISVVDPYSSRAGAYLAGLTPVGGQSPAMALASVLLSQPTGVAPPLEAAPDASVVFAGLAAPTA